MGRSAVHASMWGMGKELRVKVLFEPLVSPRSACMIYYQAILLLLITLVVFTQSVPPVSARPSATFQLCMLVTRFQPQEQCKHF